MDQTIRYKNSVAKQPPSLKPFAKLYCLNYLSSNSASAPSSFQKSYAYTKSNECCFMRELRDVFKGSGRLVPPSPTLQEQEHAQNVTKIT
jgi:hypothetical protein